MRNILTTNNGIATLLSNVDDGTNAIVINGDVIPSTDWTGTGNYTFTDGGVTFTIQKVEDDSCNIMLQLVTGTTYRLVKVRAANLSKAYMIDDPTESTIADGDFFPFYDTSAGEKKKTLWSTIIDKIKSVLGIASSGSTFLRKDGSWATPTNTTYTFATGDANGQIKVTPSGGTAQNVSVKGLGSASYETADTAATANTVAKRDANGYLRAAFINGSNAAQDPASYTSYAAFQDSNGWFRKSTLANFQTWLNCLLKTGGTLTGNLTVNHANGTTSALGQSQIALGNSTASGTAGNSYGRLYLYSSSTSGVGLKASSTTTSSNVYLPAGRDGETLATTAGTVPVTGGTFSGNVRVAGELTSGTNGADAGLVRIYGPAGDYAVVLKTATLTGGRTATFPNSTGTVAWTSSSRRIKKNIRAMTDKEAKKLLDIDVIKFDYKDDWCGGEKNRSGVIAEDVIKIIPETVHTFEDYDPNEPVDEEFNFPPEMDYQRFIPYLIKMIQIQQGEINELKAIINAQTEG